MIQNLLMKKGKNFDGMENFGAEWRSIAFLIQKCVSKERLIVVLRPFQNSKQGHKVPEWSNGAQFNVKVFE